MGTVTITDVVAGGPGTITSPNTTIGNWNTESASIERANVREEGLTRRVIKYASVTPGAGRSSLAHNGQLESWDNTTWQTHTSQTSTSLNEPFRWPLAANDFIGVGPVTIDTSTDPEDLVSVSVSGVVRIELASGAPNAFLKLVYWDVAADGALSGTGWNDFGGSHALNPTVRRFGYAAQWGGSTDNMAAIDFVSSFTIEHHLTLSKNTSTFYVGLVGGVSVNTVKLHVRRATMQINTKSR